MNPEKAMDPIKTISCDEAAPLLPLVAEGVLSPEQDPALFEHLATCDACADALAAHDLVTLAIAGRSVPKAVPEAPAKVIQFRIPLPLSMAAGLALVMGLGVLGYSAFAPDVATGTGPVAAVVAQPEVKLKKTEIIAVLPAGPERDQPMYLIRHNGKDIVVPMDKIDGGSTGGADKSPSGAVPVTDNY